MKSSRQAVSLGVVRFYFELRLRLLWPENCFSGIWLSQPLAPTRPHPRPPAMPSRAPHPNTMHNASGAVLCVYKHWGGVWECLEVFGARYVVWGPSEDRTESDGVRSQLGSQTPRNTPKHPQTLIYASYGVYACCMMLSDVCGAHRGLHMGQKYPHVPSARNLGYTQMRVIWYQN